jgi:hypothetical protein
VTRALFSRAAAGHACLVPPRDPRLRPALERALPAGSPGHDPGCRSDRSPWLFLFGDGEWHRVTVRAWWRDCLGRQVVQIEWHINGSTWEETYLFDNEKARPAWPG